MALATKRIRVDASYTFAKSYAQRGSLLKRRFIEELAESSSLEEFVNALRATVYAEHVMALTQPIDVVKVEHALRRALIELHYRYLTIVSRRGPLESLYLRYVSRNLKSVLRGLAVGKSFEEISSLIDLRAEELIGLRDVVIRAFSAQSLSEAVEGLRYSPFGDTLKEALSLYEKTRDPAVFDVELDRLVAKMLLRDVRSVRRGERRDVAGLIYPLVEGFLVVSALRAKMWGLTPMETRRLINGLVTRIPTSIVESLIESRTVEEAVKAISLIRHVRLDVPSRLEDWGLLIRSLEASFQRATLRAANGAFISPKSALASAIASLILKENEIANLVAVAVGIEERVPTSRILERLVFI